MSPLTVILILFTAIPLASSKSEMFDLGSDKVLETDNSFTAQMVGRTTGDGYKRICGDTVYTGDNLEIICLFYGYGTSKQIQNTDTINGYTFNSSYTTFGYSSIDCDGAARAADCAYEAIGGGSCEIPLVVECGDKWVMDTLTTSKLILPILLIFGTFLIIFIMCIKDYFERKANRASSLKIKASEREKWATNRIINAITKKRNDQTDKQQNNSVHPPKVNKVSAEAGEPEPGKYVL